MKKSGSHHKPPRRVSFNEENITYTKGQGKDTDKGKSLIDNDVKEGKEERDTFRKKEKDMDK